MKKSKTTPEKPLPTAKTEQPIAAAATKPTATAQKPAPASKTEQPIAAVATKPTATAQKPAPAAKTEQPVAAAATKPTATAKKPSSAQKAPKKAQAAAPKAVAATPELSVPERVGLTAGSIWRYLAEKGVNPVSTLVQEIPEEEKIIQRSIGWLAQEDKITLDIVDRVETITLKK